MKISEMNNITKRLFIKKLNEARYSYKGRKIIRLSDGMKGTITGEVAYGRAYKIEWENGRSQALGRSTIEDNKRYKILK